MKREKNIAPSLVSAALAMFVGTWAGAALAQAPTPAYPPGYPPPQYPPQQYPQPTYPQPAPRPAQPAPAPSYPAPQYPPQQAPAYPQPAPRPAPAPGYPPPAPQHPSYPQQPNYPPQTGYPPAQYPQQPGYPPPAQPPAQYPQQPGYPQQYPPPGYDPYAVQASAPPSGDLQVHRGFYLRGMLGPNYVHNQSKHGITREGAQGFGGMLSLAGGFAFENVVIYGELVGYSIQGAEYEVYDDNTDLKAGSRKLKDLYNLTGIGPGAAYYIMPLNLYVGGSLMLAFLNPAEIDIGESPNVGFGMNFSVGKQWAVSPSWCIGVASQMAWARNEWVKETFNTFTGAVAFVASFN